MQAMGTQDDSAKASGSESTNNGKVIKYHPETIPRSKKATKFGKADPKRDLAILLSFIGVVFLLCMTTLKDVGKVSDSKKKKLMGKILSGKRGKKKRDKKSSPKPESEHKEETKLMVPEDVCDLYLHESSLPGGGVGLFSARSYDQGEVLFHPSLLFLLAGIDSQYDDALLVSSAGMFPRPHPVLANVRGGYVDCVKKPCSAIMSQDVERDVLSAAALVTKREITPGQEIFLDISELPHDFQDIFNKFFPNIPGATLFSVADAIVADAKDGLPRRMPRAGRGIARKSQIDAASLKVMKKVVGRLNEEVAALLPESFRELENTVSSGSTSLSCLNNRTVTSLVNDGVCFDGVKIMTSTVDNAGKGVFAKRAFEKGEIVVPSPLLLTEDKSGELVSRAHCFKHDTVQILFCPLSFASHINHQSAISDKEFESEKECKKGPNVSLIWSPWNERNNAAKFVQVEELPKTHGLGLSFDFVATRSIEEGEEIFLNYGSLWEEKFLQHIGSDESAPFDQPIPLDDRMLPKLWK